MLGTFGGVLLVIGLIGVGPDQPAPSTTTTAASSTTEAIPSTTGTPTTSETTTTVSAGPLKRLPAVAEASAHLHNLQGTYEVLEPTETVKYRVGVFRGPDMPPAGESWSLFSFDLSALGSTEIDEVVLDLTPSLVVGAPFTEYGPLVITEVSFQDLDLMRLLTATEIQELDRLSNFETRTLDVTDAVSEASARGASRFQVRLRFSGSSLESTDEAIAQHNNFIEWVEGPTLVVTGNA